MDKALVEILENHGSDYLPLVWFEGWRVAILNDAPKFRRETMTYLERHNETDEVFVLLDGACTLYVADGKKELGVISTLNMEPRRLYNIKKGVWHNLTAQPGTSVLIVENADTSKQNSDYVPITSDLLPPNE